MDFAELGVWIAGGVTVVGIIQWLKGMAPKAPAWLWSLAAPALSVAWAVSPPWARQASGVLAVSQVGYETIFQAIRRKIGGAP